MMATYLVFPKSFRDVFIRHYQKERVYIVCFLRQGFYVKPQYKQFNIRTILLPKGYLSKCLSTNIDINHLLLYDNVKFFTCVSAVKTILQIKNNLILTPYQLWVSQTEKLKS